MLCGLCNRGVRLGAQVEGESDLVSSTVEILSIDEGGECDLDSITEFGDVGETEVQVAVDFSLDEAVPIERLLDTSCKGGSSSRVSDINGGGQARVDFVMERCAVFAQVDDSQGQTKSTTVVRQSKTVARHGLLGDIISNLSSEKNSLNISNCGCIDSWSVQKIDIQVAVERLT